MCELPSCYSEGHPVARKRHQCCECRGWIEPGEKYQRFSGVWEGSASTFKTCSDCEAFCKEANKEAHPDEYIPFGFLADEWAWEPENKPRFLAVKQKRGATIHENWLK